jgi:murein DD-endopeptidase MepM/ murein hydrolase activator NlpD
LIAPQQEGEMAADGGLGAKNALRDSSQMTETLLQRVWTWLHETFPERQIYIRSDGRVQFFTFGPSLQATLAGLTMIFLGWVAFATVNVIFKDRIIAANDHRYQQMQSAYENRMADLQLSYDELNGALVTAEDKFKATADAVQAKQNAISGFLSRETDAETAAGRNHSGSNAPLVFGGAPQDTAASDGVTVPLGAPGASDDAGSSALAVMPETPAPQPRTGQPPAPQPGFWDRLFHKTASLLAPAKAYLQARLAAPPARAHDVASAYAQHPALKALAQQTERVASLGNSETQLMTQTQGALNQGVGSLRAVIKASGLNPDQFAHRASAGEGGPEIPLDQVRIDGISDPGFTQAFLGAQAVLAELDSLTAAVRHVPLAMPVNDAQFDRSSGFGARIDPITGHYAFHPGIDFAGPWGAKVISTAAGTVIFAGYRGGYGNMVEIDHGLGIHTRYGHLSAIMVRQGARVDKGSDIGRVGSTGRSTGPHVHYEVLYDNAVRNPSSFIEAGRHVL